MIKKYSAELKWDWTLLAAMIKAESNFVEDTVAWSGATGLMQVMPVTAGEFGVHGDSLVNPEENIKVGTRLIKSLLAFGLNALIPPISAILFWHHTYWFGPCS